MSRRADTNPRTFQRMQRALQQLALPIETVDIADGAITFAKMADLSGPGVVIGRTSVGAGPPEEVPYSVTEEPDTLAMRDENGGLYITYLTNSDTTVPMFLIPGAMAVTKAGGDLTISGGTNNSNGAGGTLLLRGGISTFPGFNGAPAILQGGYCAGTDVGGDVQILAGTNLDGGTNGSVFIYDGFGLEMMHVNDTGLSWFGVATVARAGATADIKDALVAYGLLQGSSATPLNLDGGLLTAGGGVTGLPAPVGTSDATNKAYVDAIAAGLKWKQSVIAATTANGTLASAYENGDTIDAVVLATGDRILLKDQTTATENGIYIVAASGAPTRATDADSGTELVSAAVFVSKGTANADRAFVCTNDAITLGVTNIVFTGFATVLGALIAANNLSDLANVATARTNLGLATVASSGLASDLSGTLADARLTSNVPLKNAANTFTALQTVSASNLAFTVTGNNANYVAASVTNAGATGSPSFFMTILGTSGLTVWGSTVTNAASLEVNSTSGGYIGNRSNGALNLGTNDIVRWVIASDGKTTLTAPQLALLVTGSDVLYTAASVQNSSNSANGSFFMTVLGSTGFTIWGASRTNIASLECNSDSGGFIGNTRNAPLHLCSNSLIRMTIMADGKIGVNQQTPTKQFQVAGDIAMDTAGNGLYVKEGTNATMGVATLTAGTVTVNTTKVTANSRIFITVQGGTLTNVGSTYISARTAGTSFTITSTNILDASTVAWFIAEPA